MSKYLWKHPLQWMGQRIQRALDENDIQWLATSLQMILVRIDSDMIQDLFQDEMIEDGYFVEQETEDEL